MFRYRSPLPCSYAAAGDEYGAIWLIPPGDVVS